MSEGQPQCEAVSHRRVDVGRRHPGRQGEVTAERLAAVPARSARHSLLVAIFEDIERLSGDAERLSDTSLSREEAALVALSRAHCAGLPFACLLYTSPSPRDDR